MNQNKLTILLLAIGLMFVLSGFTFIFVAIPKDTLIESRVDSETLQLKLDVNRCYNSNGSAYIAENKVFCKWSGRNINYAEKSKS